MPQKRNIVTVDGLAGSGKTTLARELAKRLGYAHLNSGLLYRTVGYLAHTYGIKPTESEALVVLLRAHPPTLIYDRERGARLIVDGKDVTEEVATPAISELTSKTAVLAEVRKELLAPQQDAFEGWNLVAEGRDMGSVVFPESSIKFFVQADANVRALRRISQLYGDDSLIDPSKKAEISRHIEVEIHERDLRDFERALSPTKPAEGAIIIDNSKDPLTSVVQKMYDSCLSRGLVKGGSS